MKVYGMGEKKTPQPFIVACDKFVYIEIIRAAAKQAAEAEKRAEQAAKKSSCKKESKKSAQASSPAPVDIVELIASSVEDLCEEDGLAHMGKLGKLAGGIMNTHSRNYGFSKLSKLIRALDRFEIVPQGEENTEFYVRDTCL